ncbi:GNAT family N-acetyltransferase, partial [Kitasatospora sp. NPDC057223]|uniref:GNAT family N-acetyltransferase n=1 Tax=Kitasatospora sp. NPDC057223 TaxID=3346055 RepID=UPI003634FE3E
MTTDELLRRAAGLWEHQASGPVSFGPPGGVRVVVAPGSEFCPPGWVGVVTLGGSAVVTVPTEALAALLSGALAGAEPGAVADAEVLRRVLPVSRVLGPAALAYLSAADFRPVRPGSGLPPVGQLPPDHPALRGLEQAAGPADSGEAALWEITSPVFVVREGGSV